MQRRATRGRERLKIASRGWWVRGVDNLMDLNGITGRWREPNELDRWWFSNSESHLCRGAADDRVCLVQIPMRRRSVALHRDLACISSPAPTVMIISMFGSPARACRVSKALKQVWLSALGDHGPVPQQQPNSGTSQNHLVNHL